MPRHARSRGRIQFQPQGRHRHGYDATLTDPVGKVVVLIPVHNEVDTITKTVQAVLDQTRPPDELHVLVDNGADRDVANVIAARVAPYGVTVTQTIDNPYRKAGNLNIALLGILPGLDPADVVMGFDADSVPEAGFIANALAWMERGYGSVGATFLGRPGGGLLGTLQRAEFARFAQHQHRRTRADVLSGTGWGVRAGILRAIAGTRPDGLVYDTSSLVEDYELTLALKRRRVPVTAPGDCRVLTDVMETMPDWVSQRLRWQHGTLEELLRYGWGHETRNMIVRQVTTYLGMIALPVTVVYMAWSFALFGWQGINPLNAPLYMACIIAITIEQAWQARKAGPWAVLSALLLLPDLFYSVARQLVYLRALWRLMRGKRPGWGAGTAL